MKLLACLPHPSLSLSLCSFRSLLMFYDTSLAYPGLAFQCESHLRPQPGKPSQLTNQSLTNFRFHLYLCPLSLFADNHTRDESTGHDGGSVTRLQGHHARLPGSEWGACNLLALLRLRAMQHESQCAGRHITGAGKERGTRHGQLLLEVLVVQRQLNRTGCSR